MCILAFFSIIEKTLKKTVVFTKKTLIFLRKNDILYYVVILDTIIYSTKENLIYESKAIKERA